MSLSRSRSITSVALAVLSVGSLGSACSDDTAATCGPQDAPATGIVAASSDVSLEFGTFTAGANNDCPAANPPSGLTSVSIFGHQTTGAGFITLCIPRPDLLTQPDRTVGPDQSDADIRVVDLAGDANGCTYRLDDVRLPTGTGFGTGVCDAGKNAAGFALVLDGTVGLKRTCGATVDTISVMLTGRVAVTPAAI